MGKTRRFGCEYWWRGLAIKKKETIENASNILKLYSNLLNKLKQQIIKNLNNVKMNRNNLSKDKNRNYLILDKKHLSIVKIYLNHHQKK
jgi:hypothetical protein